MTKAESHFQDLVRQLGCIVCLLDMNIQSPCEIHHLLSGGRRRGEMFVLGLCVQHHRSGRDDKEVTSRDHSQRRFERRYGTEEMLLEATKSLLVQRAARLVA